MGVSNMLITIKHNITIYTTCQVPDRAMEHAHDGYVIPGTSTPFDRTARHAHLAIDRMQDTHQIYIPNMIATTIRTSNHPQTADKLCQRQLNALALRSVALLESARPRAAPQSSSGTCVRRCEPKHASSAVIEQGSCLPSRVRADDVGDDEVQRTGRDRTPFGP